MQTREEWLNERKNFIGASEASSIIGESKYGCALKTYFSKKDVEPDFDDSEKDVFRRGRRLEPVAASYYAEKTGRRIKTCEPIVDKNRPFLRVSPDRLVWKGDADENPGYLELKVLGRGSLYNIKKTGLPIDYVLQMQVGLAISGMTWGSYGIYCPETDDLLFWDVEADSALGSAALDKLADFWEWHVEAEVPPTPLPMGSFQCKECQYFSKCSNSKASTESNLEEVSRDDLASDAERMVALREERKALEVEESDLKAKILEAIKSIPGTYKCGSYMASLRQSESERFDSKGFKAHDEALWKKFTKISISNTLKIGE